MLGVITTRSSCMAITILHDIRILGGYMWVAAASLACFAGSMYLSNLFFFFNLP